MKKGELLVLPLADMDCLDYCFGFFVSALPAAGGL